MPRGIYNRKPRGKRKYTKRVKENVFPLPENALYVLTQNDYLELKSKLVELDELLSSSRKISLD